MLQTRLRFHHIRGNNCNYDYVSSLPIHSYICVYTYIYVLDIFSSEGIDGRKVTQLRFERNMFCHATSLFKGSPQSCRPSLDALLLMKTTWTFNSPVCNVLWPAGTRARVLLCVISQKWVVISKHFLNNTIWHFLSNETDLSLCMLRQWMDIILGPTRPSAVLR